MADLTDDQRDRFSAALARMDGDEETLVMLAGMVVEDAPTMLENLSCCVESSQFSDAARTGHALKGLLSTFETGSPVCELQSLIDAARADESVRAKSLVKQLKPALQNLIAEVHELVEE